MSREAHTIFDPPMGGCETPQPVGYYCSRERDHLGPCAAHKIQHYEQEKTGLSVNYYRVEITNPNQAAERYTAECSDIIEALGMDFNEGEAFKAIWRKAAQRTLNKGKVGGNALYDAEKIAHFGARILAVLQGRKDKRDAAIQAIKLLAHNLQTSVAQSERDPGYDSSAEHKAISNALHDRVREL